MLKLARPDLNLYFHLYITNCRCNWGGNTETNLNRKKLPWILTRERFDVSVSNLTAVVHKLLCPILPSLFSPVIYLIMYKYSSRYSLCVCSITTFASPKWEPRERKKMQLDTLTKRVLTWETHRHRRSRVCESVCVCFAVEVHQKVKA